MADICPKCGKDMGLVGRIHRCVPRDVVTTEIPPEWTYDKPKPVTLQDKPVTLRKAGVTLHSHPDCPVCKARREADRKRVTKYRQKAKGKKSTP